MYKRTLLFLALCLCVLPMMAEEETSERVYDNYLDCPDSIFHCWQRIKKDPKGDSVLIYCDLMEQYAREHPHEKKVFKGELFAASRRLEYTICTGGSEEEVLHSFELAANVARKYEYDLTLYQNYHQLIDYYLGNQEVMKSKSVIDVMYSEAEKSMSPNGLFEAHRQLGEFYMRGNKKHRAVSNLHKAIDYSYQKHNIANADLYIELSNLYGAQSDSSIMMCWESLTRGNGTKDSLRCLIRVATIYGERHDTASFDPAYRQAMEFLDDHFQDFNPHAKLMPPMLFYKAIFEGRYAEAYRIAAEVKNPETRDQLLMQYAEARGDELLYLRCDQQLHHIYDSINELMDEINIAEMQVAYNDHRAAEILQLENTLMKQRSFLLLLMACVFALLTIIAFGLAYLRGRESRRQKLANEQLNLLNEKLTKANNTKTVFLQNMSHEIRTPLNAISGFSQILANPDTADLLSPEEKEEMSKHITDNTTLLTTLVNDILVMGDIENGTYKIQLADCSVSELVRSSMSAVSARKPEGVEMVFDNGLPDGFCIRTDGQRVLQVLLNYLTNACKHTQQGSITIRTEQVEKNLKISVINTGDPIEAEMADKIFERFEKLDNFRQGTGLGLAICRTIANLLNGKVYLDTAYPVEGNCFVLELPIGD